MVKEETRTKNSARNIVFSLIAYMSQVILSFVLRRYFIYYLGAEYLGLNSLFSNILSVLSLAELGFGSAVVFAMYKPMANGDDEKVRQLLAYYKRCYLVIGSIVLMLGLCVLPFMDYFKTKAPNVDINLYIVYLLYLFNSVITYFFAHRRSLLYTSQRNDIEYKINTIVNTSLYVLQLIVLIFAHDYYMYIALAGIVGLINNMFVVFATKKMFPELVKKPATKLGKEDIKEIRKNIYGLIFHKMGSVIVYSTDSLLIFVMFGSESLGKYSNYLLIISGVTAFIAIFLNAIKGSVGNSIAKESTEQNYKLMNKLNYVYFWLISFCTICIFVLSDPFIDTILNKGNLNVLTLDRTILICLSISFFISQSRYLTGTFKECAGLFYEDRLKPVFESIINLVTSIILGKLIGLPGIVIGTIISSLTTSLWIEPYVLNKFYMHKSTVRYFVRYFMYMLSMLIAGVVTYLVCSVVPDGSLVLLIAKFGICAIVPNIVLFVTTCWFPEFNECFIWGKNLLTKIFKK